MVQALSSFIEFCYLAQRSVLNEDDLVVIDAAIADSTETVWSLMTFDLTVIHYLVNTPYFTIP